MSLLAEYLHSILLQLPFGQAYFATVSLEDCRLKMLCIMQIVQGSTRTASETAAKYTWPKGNCNKILYKLFLYSPLLHVSTC